MGRKLIAAIFILILSIMLDNIARSALISQYNALHKTMPE